MIRLLIFCVVLTTSIQVNGRDTLRSVHTGDNYIITIKKPLGYNPQKKYFHVYITDGSIGIGDYILGKSDSWKANIPANCIIIAISHIGNWHDKRPRDFIPSDVTKNVEPNFGKADRFYLFMQKELIPRIEKALANKKERVFIGHSFGGLFCLYTLFKGDKLFDRHFAISPSIWANYYELDKIEALFHKKHKSLKANVRMYVGTLEFLNKVLSSTRSFYSTLLERNYSGLTVEKKEISGANHYSIRKPAVDEILASLQ